MGRITPYTEEEKKKRAEQRRIAQRRRREVQKRLRGEVPKVKHTRMTERKRWIKNYMETQPVMLEHWKTLTENRCNYVFHLIIGYNSVEDIAKQNELLIKMGMEQYSGCMCKDNKNSDKGMHAHRHIIVHDTKRSGVANISREYPEVKQYSYKFKAITCEFHLKNLIHYVHCVKSQDVRDRVNGGFNKGTHEHHSFFNSYEDIRHPVKGCSRVHCVLEIVLNPEHVYLKCKCPRGFYATETQAFIRTCPRVCIQEGETKFKLIHEIRTYKKILRELLYGENADKDSIKSIDNVNEGLYKPTQERYNELVLRAKTILNAYTV